MWRASGTGKSKGAESCQGGPVARDNDEIRSVPAVEENRDPLSPRDRQILETLADSENDRTDLKVIAKRHGMSARALDRVRDKQVFAQELQALVLRRLQRSIPTVAAALAKSAAIEGKKGHADRKLFFAMAGMLPAAGLSPRDATAAAAAAGAAAGARLERALAQHEELTRNPPKAPVIDNTG